MTKPMNKIEKLIEELCPQGVEFRALGTLSTFSQGIQVGVSNQFPEKQENSVRFLRIVDFVKSDEMPRYIHNPGQRYLKEDGDLVMIRYGASAAGKVFLSHNGAIANNMFKINLTTEIITTKFLYAYLSQPKIYNNLNQNGGNSTMPAITFGQIGAVKIPIPPLTIQKEIVKILDNFTRLEAELEAELTARKKQYEHYREELLRFGDDVEWKTLGTLATFSQGIQVGVSNQFPEKQENSVRFLRIVDFVKIDEMPRYIHNPGQRYLKEDGDLVMIRYGASAAGKVFLSHSGAIANNMFKINLTTEIITTKFLYAYLSQPRIYNNLNQNGGNSTMPAITFGQIGAVKIPIPPISEQKRIVAILDKFDALVNDISTGLPAEISARKKQYEYYRNQLLTFKPLEAQNAN